MASVGGGEPVAGTSPTAADLIREFSAKKDEETEKKETRL
jgi:hypothetical protein